MLRLTLHALRIALITLIGLVLTYYGAFILGKIWEWFIAPYGLDPLPLRLRIGIMMLTSLAASGMVAVVVYRTDEPVMEEHLRHFVFLAIMAIAYTAVLASAFVWTVIL